MQRSFSMQCLCHIRLPIVVL